MRKTMALLFVAGLVLAGCSSGGGNDNTTGATSGGANCSDVSADPDFQVTMKNFEFDPSCIIAKNTQKLDLENDGSVSHTFTIVGTPVDVTLEAGKTQELDAPGSALKPGTYVFYCRFHGHPDGTGMAGHITIK
ncbi:MAG TPA: cupredoxin domain-containing protein [Actinomycetota bacterium]|jgi:plastocyanin